MLEVCVCGWYLEQYDDLYRVLHKLHYQEGVAVHVVSNRADEYLNNIDLPYSVRENTGLEFGAYDHYLKHVWNEESDVVFMHDDIVIRPYMKDYEIAPPEKLFEVFNVIDADQCYVFSSRADDVNNDGRHGRMFYCSTALLKRLKADGGFWFDEQNEGATRTPGYNFGIEAFDNTLKKYVELYVFSSKVRRKIYIPAIELCRRGELSQNRGVKENGNLEKDSICRA